jgi:DNA modification methylase
MKAEGFLDALKILLLRKEREAAAEQAKRLTSGAVSTTPVSAQRMLETLQTASASEGFFSRVPSQTAIGVGVTAPGIGDEMPTSDAKADVVEIPLSQMVLKGDCLDLMERTPENSFDHIVTDIPYGIDIKMMEGPKDSIVVQQDLDDIREEHDVEENIAMYPRMIDCFYRMLKPQGFCVFWFDIDHYQKLRDLAIQRGFSVQRWPLIWLKTTPCRNGAAQYNFTKNYELAMVLRKGNATLVMPQAGSVWTGNNLAERELLAHRFVKPLDLWKWILNTVALRGQKILDPFAGVGSMAIAAISNGYVPVSMEKKDIHYDRLVVNVAETYRKLVNNVKFV